MIDNRRSEARARAEQRSFEVRARSAEIARIDEELEKTGPMIFKYAVSGQDITPLKERNQALVSARRRLIASLGLPEDYTDV